MDQWTSGSCSSSSSSRSSSRSSSSSSSRTRNRIVVVVVVCFTSNNLKRPIETILPLNETDEEPLKDFRPTRLFSSAEHAASWFRAGLVDVLGGHREMKSRSGLFMWELKTGALTIRSGQLLY